MRQNLLKLSTMLECDSPYFFGCRIMDQFEKVLHEYSFDKIFFITNPLLNDLYGKSWKELFEKNDIQHQVILINDGEANKSFAELSNLCEILVAENVTKASIVIAFGGGCLGNIVGLAASMIFRGIRYVEIPTTLMGITDSTLSNKQAINGESGKNQFGFYYAPLFVWSDIQYVMSEKRQNINAALVEGIKNGLIFDVNVLSFLETKIRNRECAYSEQDLYEIALTIIRSKLEILKNDPSEKGLGMILEYGHTFGHAIEWLTHGKIIHGVAVAIGMCIAAELSHRLGYITRELVDKHYNLFSNILGLDLVVPDEITSEKIMQVVMSDNKKNAKGVKYVLLQELGQCCNPDGDYMIEVEKEEVVYVLDDFLKKARKRGVVYV